METKNPVEVKVRPEVLRGAEWLDEVRPGWDQEVDLTKLNLNSCTDCVVGQLWGMAEAPHIADVYDESYGFDVYDRDLTSGAYAKLTEEWRDLIASRR